MSIVHGESEHLLRGFHPGALCPCGCGQTGSKLSTKTGHVVKTCGCASCRNGRNVRKGKRGQAKTYKALGGIGPTPGNEESGRFLPIFVRPEVKNGYKRSTVKLYEFIGTDFFRRALSQSERSIPIGNDAKPAVSIDGKWMVVKL